MSRAERPLGVNEVNNELGCCEKTVRRFFIKGKLDVHKIGDGTSPIRMDRKALQRMKKMRGVA